ncbi:MAG: hypothetical protein NW203_01695 [Hyphomonadaceae bacterium]|nr:hypothetical protein [Hyphomonadaceae bacterium]
MTVSPYACVAPCVAVVFDDAVRALDAQLMLEDAFGAGMVATVALSELADLVGLRRVHVVLIDAGYRTAPAARALIEGRPALAIIWIGDGEEDALRHPITSGDALALALRFPTPPAHA